MHLELDILNIKNVVFAPETNLSDGVLKINRNEIIELLRRDKRISQVNVELAHPGEKCRIFRVTDVIEPRAKIGQGGVDFPGVLGKQVTAGEGNTCVLRGAAVVTVDSSEMGEPSSSGPMGDIIDMSGPGAEAGIYGKTNNVVVLAEPAAGVSPEEYRIALKIAGLKAAAYLARAGDNLKPDDTEIYELPSLTEMVRAKGNLPRVAYIFQVISLQFEPVPGDPVLYGGNIEQIIPTVLHPNEVLDGAITRPQRSIVLETYSIQNHPVIKELYRRHGKDLYFTGVIIATAPNNVPEYERIANIAANLAKWILGADGVILTKAGGGAPEVVMARTAQRCEELGIKTLIAMVHMGADTSDIKFGATTIFNMPELNAIVSMGIPFDPINLPSVEKVIGQPRFAGKEPAVGARTVRRMVIKGALNQIGYTNLTAVRY